VSSAALVANPAWNQRRGLQFLTPLVNVTRERPQARLTANAAITQFQPCGGHQAAGVFVQMRPNASKVLGDLGIGVHTQLDSISRW